MKKTTKFSFISLKYEQSNLNQEFTNSALGLNCVVTRTTDPNADKIDAELTDTSTITKLPFNHTFNDTGVNVMVTINGEQSEGGK